MDPRPSFFSRFRLSPTLGLGTRGILALLAVSLVVQAAAVAIFLWDRSQRVTPAFQRLIAGQVSVAVERLDEATPTQRLRLARRYAQRGLVLVPAELLPVGAVQPVAGALSHHDLMGFSPLIQQRLAAQGLDSIALDSVFLNAQTLPQPYLENLFAARLLPRPLGAPPPPPQPLQGGDRGFGQTGDRTHPPGLFDQRHQQFHQDRNRRHRDRELASDHDDEDRSDDREDNWDDNERPYIPGWVRDLRARLRPTPALSLQLSDGSQVYALLHFENKAPGLALTPLLLIGLFAFLPLLLAFVALLKLRQSTLGLGEAARRFGEDLDAPALRLKGPNEVTQTVDAFNAMQQRIRGLVGERTRMLAAISHDLRTQLTKLRLRAEFIEPEGQREKAVRDIERLDRLLGQVVQFARMDAGVATPEAASRLDAASLLRALYDDMAWQDKVSLELPQSLVLNQQRGNLERVLINLIENALRYGERASVRLESAADGVKITIDDQGPGIPQDELARVFEPFYRLESSRNLATGGSGLGLSIVKGLVELMGGTITLSNRPEGGLRVALVLPDLAA